MESDSPTHAGTYLALGAAAAALSMLALPRGASVSVIVCALLFVLLRRRPRGSYLAAATAGGVLTLLASHLISSAPEVLLLVLFLLGVLTGVALGLRVTRDALPGFRFFREDFLEFCGFVGLLAAFPAILAAGIRGAADLAGQLAFELAFLGVCVLLPLTALGHGVVAVRSLSRSHAAAPNERMQETQGHR
jgi:hypothetical protein